jgi:hypothetical protein
MQVSSNQRVALGVGLLVVAGIAYWTLSGPRGSDEERIRRAIEDIRLAVEARSAKTIVEHLALNYHERKGWGARRSDKASSALFQSKAELTCVAVTQSIEVSDDKRSATATVFAAVFEGGSLTGLELPEGGDAFRIEARFAKESDGDWRAVWHERERVTVQTVLELAKGE